MNWKDIKKLIRKELNEATTVDAGGSKFNLRTGVNKNPTKLGIKIQFEPKGEFLAPDVKGKLEVALQEKLNAALLQYNIQVSKDTDIPREHVIGFFIPISQMKNLIVKALGGSDIGAEIEEPKVAAPAPDTNQPPTPDGEIGSVAEADVCNCSDLVEWCKPQQANCVKCICVGDVDNNDERAISNMIEQEMLNEALRVRDLNEISKVVYKEDFYGFINAGQNVMRTLEEHGFEPKMAKKYLEHLVKNNIL